MQGAQIGAGGGGEPPSPLTLTTDLRRIPGMPIMYPLNNFAIFSITIENCYGRTLSERPCYILLMFFYIFFFIPALVGQTAERIFTKLSHVVDIRHHL